MTLSELKKRATDDLGQKLLSVAIGIGLYLIIKAYVEPWMVETVCRELWKCG